MYKKTFDCVDFQRKVREKSLKQADYDINKLIEQVHERLKNNELNSFLEKNKISIIK